MLTKRTTCRQRARILLSNQLSSMSTVSSCKRDFLWHQPAAFFLVFIVVCLFIDSSSSTEKLSRSFNLTEQLTQYQQHIFNGQSVGHDDLHHRTKRGVFQLAGMISCVSGCDPLMYKGYGCYCGYGGAGVPINGIDRCCMEHDMCYTYSDCSQIKQYIYPYTWDCIAPGYATCGSMHSMSMSSSSHFSIMSMSGGNDRCASQLCECDLNLAHCLSYYRCPKMKVSCPTSRFSFSLPHFSFG